MPTPRQQSVLDVLREIQPATTEQVAAGLGVDDQAARNLLRALKGDGLVQTLPGRGARKFELTAERT